VARLKGKKGDILVFEFRTNHDIASLEIFWLRDERREEPDYLPAPDVLAQEIVEDLEAAFRGLPYLNHSS